jgi:hypothetical protein
MAYLLRRNIPASLKDGNVIVCGDSVHSRSRPIRVKVVSRYATDCDRAPLVSDDRIADAQYVAVVFLNIGYFYLPRTYERGGADAPELYILPAKFVSRHLERPPSGFQKLRTMKIDLCRYEGEAGVEQIAERLGIDYPRRKGRAT